MIYMTKEDISHARGGTLIDQTNAFNRSNCIIKKSTRKQQAVD